jgi:putative endonuclease
MIAADPSPRARPSQSPADQARRALGRRGERLAADHLVGRGCDVLARNVRTRHGEIDLIVSEGDTLVFAEVKTRTVNARQRRVREDQDPLSGLDVRQRLRLRRLASAWLRDSGGDRTPSRTIRFDAIGVVIDTSGRLRRIDHVVDAW